MEVNGRITRTVLLISVALAACSNRRLPTYVTNAGNCRVLFDRESDEFTQYLANARTATGCQHPKGVGCPPQIRLELTDYPAHISRRTFEKPDWKSRNYARARLRTTSLVGYDLWLSQYFSPDPWLHWGYEIQFRSSAGKVLRSTVVAMRDHPDCSNYVVLSGGNSIEMDIPLTGDWLERLDGDELLVSVVYAVSPFGSPKAVAGTIPIVTAAVSNTITIKVQ